MAQINKNVPKFKMPASMTRAEAGPLDFTSVYYSFSEAARYAADASGVAYVGQLLSVVDESNKNVSVYKIADDTGRLVELGSDVSSSGSGGGCWMQYATINLSGNYTTTKGSITFVAGELQLQTFDCKEIFTDTLIGKELLRQMRKGKINCTGGFIQYIQSDITYYGIISKVNTGSTLDFVGTLYKLATDGTLSIVKNGSSFMINVNLGFKLNLNNTLTYITKTSYNPAVPQLAVIDVPAAPDANPVTVDISDFCDISGTGTSTKYTLIEDLTINVPKNTRIHFSTGSIDLNDNTLIINGSADGTSIIESLVLVENCNGTIKLNNIIVDGGTN
jgi:hypothetical protein